MHTENKVTTNRKPMQECAMKMKNKKIKKKTTAHDVFVLKLDE